MSKNLNISGKDNKKHKRNNSNSYNNTITNMTPTISNNLTNQSDLSMNTQGNHTTNHSVINNLNRGELQLNKTYVNNASYTNNNLTHNNLTNINNTNVPTGIPSTTFSNNNNNDGGINKVSEDFKSIQQKVECVGKVPSARFGHTIVLVSAVKIVLFGGAVGDTRNFQFTNETYVLNLMTKIWLRLECKINN